MKKLLSLLLSLVLMSGLIFSDSGYAANANAASKFANLGQTYITLDGTRYQTKAYKDANEDIFISVSAIETLLGVNARSRFRVSGKPYGNLTKACSDAGMESFEYDDVLNYVYIWSEVLENEFGADADLPRIDYYALGTPSDNRINFKHFFSILDKAVKNAAPERLTEWRRLSEFKTLRYSRKNVCRMDAAMLVERLAAFLGNEYCDFNYDFQIIEKQGCNMWNEVDAAQNKCIVENHSPYNLGGFENSEWIYDMNWDWRNLSAYYVIGRASLFSGNILFDFDKENKSMHFDEYITTKETMLAAARLLDSVDSASSTFVKDSTDPSVRSYNESIITPEILEFASDLPDVSDDNIPEWKGVIWSEAVENGTVNADLFSELVTMWSQWGFNSVRYNVPYTLLFSLDGSKVNEAELYRLDQIIAAALKNNIHIELVLSSLPGQNRDLSDDQFIENGQYDLFTNPEKQEQAKLVWETLSDRYAEIPNSALTFYMLLEITSVDATVYHEEIVDVYTDLIDSIRKYNPDRFVVFEDSTIGVGDTFYTDNVARVVYDSYDNVQVSYNYVNTFVYYHMTIEEGEQIDNCPRSMFEAEYPQKYYTVESRFMPDDPLIMTGELPAGTKIDMGIHQIYTEEADFIITADGNTVYSEHIVQDEYCTEFEVSARLSGSLPYRSSEKTISFTLEEDTDQIEFIIDGAEWDSIDWCGMIVTLPEEYAVERIYRPSVYEFYLEHGRYPEGDESDQLLPHPRMTSEIIIAPYEAEGYETSNHIIINPDVTYATDVVRDEASINAIDNWIKVAQNRDIGEISMRYECASFSGNYYSCVRFYDDLLKSSKLNDLGWYTNDFSGNNYVYVPDGQSYALEGIWPDSKNVKYGDGWLRIDMMNSYIKYLDVTRIK